MGSFQTFRQCERFPGVDGTRAICALVVIVAHAELLLPGPNLLRLTYLGVDMFFAISGFLIVTLLLRERERTGGISLRRFYFRRTLRIFPIYYLLIGVVLLGYALVSPWKPNGLQYYLASAPVLLLYLQDLVIVPMGLFFHTWSLAMEEQFYLVWPLLEKLRRRALKVALLALAIAACQVVNFGLLNTQIDAWFNVPQPQLRPPIFLCTFTPILLGVLLAHLMHEPRSFAWVQRLCGQAWSTPLWLLALFGAAELGVGEDIQGLPRLLIHLSMTLLLASVVLGRSPLTLRLLETPWLAGIGRISYGVYLYHTAVILGLEALAQKLWGQPPAPLLLWALTTAITLVVARASFRWIEAPTLALRHRG